MNIDDKDFGNIDPGIAEIANFEPSDYADINNYGAAEDYAEQNDESQRGDGGNSRVDGDGDGGAGDGGD